MNSSSWKEAKKECVVSIVFYMLLVYLVLGIVSIFKKPKIENNLPFDKDRFEIVGTYSEKSLFKMTIEQYYVDKETNVVYYVSGGAFRGLMNSSIAAFAVPLFNADGTLVTKEQLLN